MRAQGYRRPTAGIRESGRAAATAAWSLVLLYAAGFGLATWLDLRLYGQYAPEADRLAVAAEAALIAIVGATFCFVGALIVARRPRHPIGWLLLASAGAFTLERLTSRYALLAVGDAPIDPPALGLIAAWLSSWTWTGVLGVVLGLVLVPLLYPDGRLPSRRWRVVPWVAGVAIASFALFAVTVERLNGAFLPVGEEHVAVYSISNPLGVVDLFAIVPYWEVAVLPFAIVIVLAAASVGTRFRRSHGVERLQMRWFLFAGSLLLFTVIVTAIGGALVDLPRFPALVEQLPILLFAVYPAAVGVAVLRYQLYDIDRIISRTVSYGLVVAVLGAVYVAGVVGLGTAVSAVTGQEGSDLVVATSVLAVVALFRPVRARVQTAVDRRFNRTGYQARLAVDRFADDLRDEVDLGALSRMTAETAAATVQPDRTSVWLGGREEAP